jgi:CRP/FNR family transcriptional regulator
MSMTAVLPQPSLARARSAVINFGWRPVARSRPEVQCSECFHRKVCLPGVAHGGDLDTFDELISVRRTLSRGAMLYRSGDRFEALYAVHSGGFKTVGRLTHGEEKITGFYLPGELIGLDAIDNARHSYEAVALEDSEACVIPFARLEAASLKAPALRHEMFRLLSRDISRDQGLMLLLGVMTAEQRLAAFVLNLSQRYQRLGFSPDRFTLRMTREEIGSYLGLTLETISRQFSRLQRNGLLAVDQREIEVRNRAALMEMAGY